MTWLQIAYVVLLYFLLAEAVFQRCIKTGTRSFEFATAMFKLAIEDMKLSTGIASLLAYILWPLTFTVAAMYTRQQRIKKVTSMLTRGEA